MKTLCATPSRWFGPLFEVPVIRRIPRCRETFPFLAQSAPSRRRRPRLFSAARCGSRRGCFSQTV